MARKHLRQVPADVLDPQAVQEPGQGGGAAFLARAHEGVGRLLPPPPALPARDRAPLAGRERLGAKPTDTLVRAIEKTRPPPLARFLYGLGIRHVGRHLSEVLARHFGAIDAVRGATPAEFMEIHEIGPEVAQSVSAFFSSEEGKRIVDRLLREVTIRPGHPRGGKVSGKTFLITGPLGMPRAKVQEIVRREGGAVAAGLSRKVDFLVEGADPGSKLAKAREMGISVISEKELLRMTGEAEG